MDYYEQQQFQDAMAAWAQARADKKARNEWSKLIERANSGDIQALHTIQNRLFQSGDTDRYEQWCSWGAERGDDLSIYRVAENLSYSGGIDDPTDESVRFLKYHAEKGTMWPMALYGLQVWNRDWNYEESAKYSRKAMEQGSLLGLRHLAFLLDQRGHKNWIHCDENGDSALALYQSALSGEFKASPNPPWNDNANNWWLERMQHEYQQIVDWNRELNEQKQRLLDESTQQLLALVGQEHIRDELNVMMREVKDYQTSLKEWTQSREGPRPRRPSFHFVLTGSPGTGKNELARSLAKRFFATSFTDSPDVIEVSRSDLVAGYIGQTAIQTKNVLDSAKHKVLFIDEAYTLKKDSSRDFGQEAIDTLLKFMEDNRGDLTVIVAGYQREMKGFLRSNPGLASRFNQTIHLRNLNLDELVEVWAQFCQNEGVNWYEDVEPGIRTFYKGVVGSEGFGNAREVRKLFENAHRRYKQRIRVEHPLNDLAPEGICFEDVFGHLRERIDSPAGKNDLNQLLAQLDQMVGLDSVKQEVRRFVDSELARFDDGDSWLERGNTSHMLLLGPPGTGKTEVARIIGKIMYLIGLVPEDSFTELSRADLVGAGSDGIEKTLSTLDSCLGGVVFIDEIYTLVDQSDTYSAGTSETLETLMKYMEDHRGEIAIIGAGYAEKLSKILEVNPGLESRFGVRLNFEAYNADDLTEIFKRMSSGRELIVDQKLLDSVRDHFGRLKRDESFGNAREVRNLVDAAERNARSRESRMGLDPAGTTLTQEDLPIKLAPTIGAFSQAEVEAVLGEVDQLVGVDSVKMSFNQLVAFAKVASKRKEAGLPYEQPSLHFAFTGPPGTGKTTVARLLGRLFKGLGLLSSGHLVEASRSDLVAGYVGQTALKTNEIVERSLGGVLFVDEAYALVEQGSENNYGAEAIAALLLAMENNRSDLSVIFAGYPREMEHFISTNPGLRSRVGNTIVFEPLEGSALYDVANRTLATRGYELSSSASLRLIEVLNSHSSDPEFGNARGVRRLIDEMIMKQSLRVSDLVDATAHDLTTIEVADLS